LEDFVLSERTSGFITLSMSSTAIDVAYVADLARLRLSADEIQQFQKQLTDVVGYVGQLQQVDVSGAPEKPGALCDA